jgi:1,2-diacylglycerol 3-alpha-glucosyltransferase
MNIAVISNLFAPVVSGSSTQSAGLSRELARLGHKPFVVTARIEKTSPAYEEIDGVPIYRIPAVRLPRLAISMNFPWLSYSFTPGNLTRIEEVFRRQRPEIIHLHNHMFDLSFSAVLMHRKYRIPLVITIHTMIRHNRELYNLLLYPADRVLLRKTVVEQAQMLICPDINIGKYVREAFPQSRRALVPYGISIPGEPEEGILQELRERYQLNGKRVILSLGNVIELRDRRELIAALPSIRKAIPNVVALIVGGESTDRPRRLSKQLGVEDAVIFTGPVPHHQVKNYLALAELEIHLFYQDVPENMSLGIASLEAMAAGKVILAWANENTYGRGVLRDGCNIVFVDPYNPSQLAQTIIDLLLDHEKRRRIGDRARQAIQEQFSWSSVCSRTLEVYEEVMKKDRHRLTRNPESCR